MAESFDVCIRGTGIVGRTLALMLARARLRVALVASPKPAQSAPDVRAYALSPASRQLLESVRCWPDERTATPVLAMQVYGDRGTQVHFDALACKVPALNWIVDVPTLERQLADAIKFQADIELVSEPVSTPLTVVCEGRASATRSELGVEFNVRRYPQHAIATRLECEHPHEQIARQWFSEREDILAFLPLDGPLGKAVAAVWSAPSDQVSDLMALNQGTFAARLAELSHGALGAIELSAARASWPLIRASAQRWVGRMPAQVGGSFALAGDAAHAMHPLAGQGLNVGLGDVAELARVLSAKEPWRAIDDIKLLRRYARARQSEWLRMSMATDALQHLFACSAGGIAALRNWGMTAFDLSGPIKSRIARLAMGTI